MPLDRHAIAAKVDAAPDRQALTPLILNCLRGSYGETDLDVASDAMRRIYALLSLDAPTFHRTPSLRSFYREGPEDIREDYPEIWGSLEAPMAYQMRWTLANEPDELTPAGAEFAGALWDLVHSAGVCYAYEGDCWIADRFSAPPGIELADDSFRYHSAEGPAIQFADGFVGHALHGIPVPAEFFEPDVDPGLIIGHENAEIRRVGITDLLGWPRVLEHIGAKVIDQDDDPVVGALYHGDLNGERIAVLKVTCPSTGHVFGLGVALTCKSAAEARASTFPTADFSPDAEA